MNIVEKFQYKELDSVTQSNGTRHYIDPEGNYLPSVTTILSATKDMTILDEWRNRIGDEEADKQVKEAVAVGKLLHDHVERHILGMERKKGTNMIHTLVWNMAENLIQRGLNNVDEVWGVEIPLYFPGAYAGRSDLIGTYKGVPSIIDHKNAKKIKKKEWIEDYFLQGAAYALAHNTLFGTDINQIVILMSARDLNFETFIVNGDEFHDYTNKWVERLETYLTTVQN